MLVYNQGTLLLGSNHFLKNRVVRSTNSYVWVLSYTDERATPFLKSFQFASCQNLSFFKNKFAHNLNSACPKTTLNRLKPVAFQQVSKHELRCQNICPDIVGRFFGLKWMQLTKKNLDSRPQLNSGTEVLNDNVLSYTCFKPERRQSLPDCPADCTVNCNLKVLVNYVSITKNSPTPCLFFQRLTKSWDTT